MNSRENILKGKTAIITGGTRGLGRALTEKLALIGVNVVMIGTNENAIKLSSSLSGYGEVVGLKCDVRSIKCLVDTMDFTINKFGSIDVLINNAASKGKDKKDFYEDFEKYKLKKLNDVMNTNLNTMFLIFFIHKQFLYMY